MNKQDVSGRSEKFMVLAVASGAGVQKAPVTLCRALGVQAKRFNSSVKGTNRSLKKMITNALEWAIHTHGGQ